MKESQVSLPPLPQYEQTGGMPPAEQKTFAVTCLMSNRDGKELLIRVRMGLRTARSEQEAKGLAVTYALKSHPGYSLDDVIAMEVAQPSAPEPDKAALLAAARAAGYSFIKNENGVFQMVPAVRGMAQVLDDDIGTADQPEASEFILVPREPTEEMVAAAERSDREYTDRNFGPNMPLVQQGPYDHWNAMVQAAPKLANEVLNVPKGYVLVPETPTSQSPRPEGRGL